MEKHLGISDDDLASRLLEAERALSDAEFLYQRFADALPYGIWTCGPDGELLHISQSFLNLIGMTLEECQRFGWWGKLPPDEIETTRAHWKHCLMNALPYDHEHDLLGRDGIRHAVLVRGVPVKDDMNRVISWVGINLDIDDRRRAQAELRESETRFRTMADEAPVLIWMTGPTGESIYYNRRCIELTGVSLDEQLGRGWISNLHPEDQQRAVAVFHAALERRQPFENSYRARDIDGNYRILLDRGVPRFLEDGSFAGYVGCCTDITEMREARETTARANERYRMVCDALNAMVYEFDVVNGVIQHSNGLYDLIGIRPDQAEPTYDWWRQRIHPDDVGRIEKSIWRTITANEIYEAEYRVLNSLGQYVPVLDRGVRRLDKSGNTAHLIGCITRITETRSALPGSSSQDLMQTIVEFCPSAAFMLDQSENFVFANERALKLFGCDLEGFAAKWQCIVRPKKGAIGAEWAAAVKHMQHLSAEFAITRPDKELVEVQLELEPVRDTKGVVAGYIGLLANVSKRKQNQYRLEQSEALYRSLAESSPNHVFSRLPNGDCDYVSRSWCEYTGMSLEESLGKNWLSVIHPEDAALVDYDADHSYDVEQRVRRHDGEYRWFLIRRNPIFDSRGEIAKWLGTCTDINDLKSAEAALRESDQRLGVALGLTNLVLFNMDLELRYTWFQGPMLIGITCKDVLGKTDSEIFDVEQAKTMTELKRRIIQGGESIRQAVWIDLAGQKTYEVIMEPLLGGSGAIIGLTGAAIDRTPKIHQAVVQANAAISAI